MRAKNTEQGRTGNRGHLMQYHLAQRNIVFTILFSIVTALSLSACSDANNVTGPPEPVPLSPDAKLSNLTVNTGPLDPAFSSEIDRYKVNVATSVASVTVTAQSQNANASMTINGEATASGQVRTIQLGGAGSNTPIQIVVTAVNGSQNTYIVDVNRAPPGGNNNLRSLTVSSGSLTPSFTASTTIYAVNVANSVNSVTVAAQPQDAGATVNINGQTTTSRSVSLVAPGSGTAVTIVVTAPNGNQNTYVVTVNRAAPGGNNNLRSLTVSQGSLSPTFTANITSYTVNVASSVDSVAVTATLQDTNASMTVNGQGTSSGQARTISLDGASSSTLIPIVVTAPNGTQNTYVVTVNRAALGGNDNLQSLTLSSGALAPPFAASRTSYTVNVASSVASVTVEATPQDPGATVSINGQTTKSLSVRLGEAGGANTRIEIEVRAPNGNDKTYTVDVNRAAPSGNNNLSALIVSAGALVPEFSAATTAYDVTAPNTTENSTVTATVQDSTATLEINGSPATSGVPSAPIVLNELNKEIRIVVTAGNGTTITYIVNITRDAPPAP